MQPIISETNNLWGSSSSSSKYFEFYADFLNAEKNWTNIFSFWDNCIWIGSVTHSFLLRENTFRWVWICYKTVWRFQILLKEYFFELNFLAEWSKNMTKILLCRFKPCFGPFNMLAAHKRADTRLFRHLSNRAFCSL